MHSAARPRGCAAQSLWRKGGIPNMRKRHGLLPRWLVVAAFLALCGYLFVSLIQYQVSIGTKQQELLSVQSQLNNQLTENAELSNTLEQGDDAIIERYAREQGYAKPNERVFVDISGK